MCSTPSGPALLAPGPPTSASPWLSAASSSFLAHRLRHLGGLPLPVAFEFYARDLAERVHHRLQIILPHRPLLGIVFLLDYVTINEHQLQRLRVIGLVKFFQNVEHVVLLRQPYLSEDLVLIELLLLRLIVVPFFVLEEEAGVHDVLALVLSEPIQALLLGLARELLPDFFRRGIISVASLRLA